MENTFKIEKNLGSISIKKDGKSFSLDRRIDGDVWLGSSYDIEIPIERYYSSYYGLDETATHKLFENLMIVVFGQYVLEDYNDEYNGLPKDFIDLDNRTITWHSDGGGNSTLKLKAIGNQIIISIIGEKEKDKTRWVRFRTSGSEYKEYYNFFIALYRDLEDLISRIEEEKRENTL